MENVLDKLCFAYGKPTPVIECPYKDVKITDNISVYMTEKGDYAVKYKRGTFYCTDVSFPENRHIIILVIGNIPTGIIPMEEFENDN